MESNTVEVLQNLVKALEAGNYNAAPSTLVQGAALQTEDLSPVMHNVTYSDENFVLSKMLKVESCKSTLAQIDRQLSYGVFGGSAQLEGNIGQEEVGEYVRVVFPMAYYSEVRRVTFVSNMVATVDGKKGEEREALNAAKKIAGDIEFDLFRGLADFSDGGVFNGNPNAIPGTIANMHGLDLQVRQSDSQRNARDQMFAAFGSDESVVIGAGSGLTQTLVEKASVRSTMNFGQADVLCVDPKVLSDYNLSLLPFQRNVYGGSPLSASGSDLQSQWVSGGTVKLKASRFLSGRTGPNPLRPRSPAAPTSVTLASVTTPGVTTPFTAGQTFAYYVTTGNEVGESPKTHAAGVVTIAATGDEVTVTITHPGSGVARWFSVYRTEAGKTTGHKFIGRVKINESGGTTVFHDFGNKAPGFVTGFLVQGDTMAIKELAPYSRVKLAVSDLTTPEAHFRFCCLAVYQPRKNVLIDNLIA